MLYICPLGQITSTVCVMFFSAIGLLCTLFSGYIFVAIVCPSTDEGFFFVSHTAGNNKLLRFVTIATASNIRYGGWRTKHRPAVL